MSRYTPRGDSLARKVIDFLIANPDDELTPKDVGVKFDTDAKSVHASLKAPVDNGWLVKVHNDDLELVFRLGPQALQAGSPFAQLTGSAPHHASIDVTADRLRALSVDDDVPIDPPKPQPGEKWEPLFDRLKRPGQSIAIPLDWRTSLSREATRRNKLQTEGGPTYKVGKCHKTPHARIWRHQLMPALTDDEATALRTFNNPQGQPTGHFTGRCGRCASDDLWDDNLAYGCNRCGAFWTGIQTRLVPNHPSHHTP